MAAQYLDEFIRELRRDGERTFRKSHAASVLVVTRAEGAASGVRDTGETTVMADTSGWRIQQVSLLNRVFAISRGAFEKPGPVTLGRTDASDIVIPDDSVSKRHCVFEAGPGGVTIMDAGSTNGTMVGKTVLEPNQPRALVGGDAIQTGNFSFRFETPDSFVAYLERVVKR
jgi:FHA domain